MKRKILLTLISLVCVMCFALGFGCSCNDDEGEGENSPAQSNVITLVDFETWETGLQHIRTGQYFGALRENSDLTYVKSGKKSLQIHPLGGFRGGASPIFFISTVSELCEFDYSDFSAADKITFEFYNAEEKDVPVAVGLITTLNGVDSFQKTSIEYQNLKTGWNTITYEVNVSALAINTDVKNIQGIYVAFENAQSMYEENAPNIYMDDVIIYKKDVASEIQDLVVLDKNEYINFEKDWQKYVVGIRNTSFAPVIEIGDASGYTVGEDGNYTLDQTPNSKVSGEKVLKVLAKTGLNNAASYPGIEFAPALMQRSVFGSMKEEDYGRITFTFDVYNNSSVKSRLGISFYTNDNRNRKEYGMDLEPYSWATFSVLMKDLYFDFMEDNKNSTKLFTDPGVLGIYWAEFTDADREFFFDNFRYEVEEKDLNAKPTITLAPFVRVAEEGARLELPIAKVTDKYDLKLEAKLAVFKKAGEEWLPLDLVEGLIPITKDTEYKIVARATNSLKNEAVVEYYFRGVAKVEKNLWISYDYSDEADNVYLEDRGRNNSKTFLESVNIGEETRYGVIKAVADNADAYGAGYLGFKFPKQGLDEAAESEWDYFTISIYIEASVSSVDIYSLWAKIATNVPTNRWTEITVKKDLLNCTGTEKSWVNSSSKPYSDVAFYEAFEEICGNYPSQLLFIYNVNNRNSDNKITYYLDKVTWGVDKETSFPDLDDYAPDIYGS